MDGDNGSKWHLTQPSLIKSVLEDPRLDGKKVKTKDVPMATSKLMGRHKDAESFDGHFNYWWVAGKLNFLEQSTRGDISYATHMCARFCSAPKFQHGEAVKWLGRYLKGTADKGLIMHPDLSKGMEVHPDADYAGAWEPEGAGEDVDTARSRQGYIVSHCGVPFCSGSPRCRQRSLCPALEAEFIALATATRAAIPIQCILMEMKELGHLVVTNKNSIHCRVCEDNNGALAIANLPKTRPRTKHINVKYFQWLHWTQGEGAPFSFHKIKTKEQPADMLTKPLVLELLVKHR